MTMRALLASAICVAALAAVPAAAASGAVDLRPVITSVTPAVGAYDTTLSIHGRHLDTVSSVTVDDEDVSFVPVDATLIEIGQKEGTHRVKVTNPAGTASRTFNFHFTPHIYGFWPWKALPGDTVEFRGDAFTGVTRVKFGSVPAQFTVEDDTTIDAIVPNRAVTGNVTVSTPWSSGVTERSFIVIRRPTITSFTATAGVAGDLVKVFGTNLDSVDEVVLDGLTSSVNHFRVDRDFLSWKLGFWVPSGARSGRISVSNAAGTATSAGKFDVVAGVDSVTPGFGLPGDRVEIDGWGFKHASKVLFGGFPAAFTIDSDSMIHATVGGSSGSGIGVVVRGHTALGSFVRVVPPIVDFFTPIAPIGGRVGFGGSFFEYDASGAINGVDLGPFGTYVDHQIQHFFFTVPAGATTGKLAFTNIAGTRTTATPLVVSPAVTGFTPLLGRPGSTVEIDGTSFTGVVQVSFDGHPVNFTLVDDSTIRAVVPNDLGRWKIRVMTCTGEGAAYASSGESPHRFGVIGEAGGAPPPPAPVDHCGGGFLAAIAGR